MTGSLARLIAAAAFCGEWLGYRPKGIQGVKVATGGPCRGIVWLEGVCADTSTGVIIVR